MSKHPKINLQRLREIGWSIWDPLALSEEGEEWQGAVFADEYDSYLLKAAGMVRNGKEDREIIAYLVRSETDDMGMGDSMTARLHAHRLVKAIRAERALWSDQGSKSPNPRSE